jgi:hypothetical protein
MAMHNYIARSDMTYLALGAAAFCVCLQFILQGTKQKGVAAAGQQPARPWTTMQGTKDTRAAATTEQVMGWTLL